MNPRPAEVPGLWVEAGFAPDGDTLSALLSETTAWDTRMRARRTASFGVPYNYSGIIYLLAPVPEPVAVLMGRLILLFANESGFQSLFDEPFPYAGDGVDADLNGLGDSAIGPGRATLGRIRFQ